MPETKKVLVRLAHLTDLPQLMKLQDRAVQSMNAGRYSPYQMRCFLQHIGAVDVRMVVEGRFYVAEIVDRIVGCGGWWPTERRLTAESAGGMRWEPDITVERMATLRALYVDPEQRHLGVAHRLADVIERAARAQYIDRFEVISPEMAEGFFSELGYRAVERFNLSLTRGLKIPLVHLTMRAQDTGRMRMPETSYLPATA